MIVCDLGVGLCGLLEKRGLSYVGETYETYIGYKLAFQDDVPFLSFSARFCEVGSLTDGTLDVYVSASSFAALGSNERIAVFHKVLHDTA